jgi:hypothetical protein
MSRLVARTASAIQSDVTYYAGPATGGRRKVIEGAIYAAMREFGEQASGRARADGGVIAMFHHLGWSEAVDGRSLEAMWRSFEVATHEVWSELHRIARDLGLAMPVLGRLGNLLFDLAATLRDAVEDGHAEGRRQVVTGVIASHVPLIEHLLHGDITDDIHQLADQAGWPLPQSSLVMCAERPVFAAQAEAALVHEGLFTFAEPPNVFALCDSADKAVAIEAVHTATSAPTVVISPPAPPHYLHDAVKLAIRADGLVRSQQLPAQRVVDCVDHELMLWLEAEPLLRERAIHGLLAPLQRQSPHRRYMLALTLAHWLEQRVSATQIGRQLGVHPQTVRYRLRKARSLLGKQLDDPELAFPMLLALRSALPVWASGVSEGKDSG